MATFAFPRDADIANHAANPTPRDEDSGALLPDLVEFDKESFVLFNVSKLSLITAFVLLQRPVWR
jgi:hypothetical protein